MDKFFFTIIAFAVTACSSDDNGDTSTGMKREFQLDELLDNLQNPWGMCFPSDDEILFTERGGKMWLYDEATGEKSEITGVPDVHVQGQGGLLDVALHPDFEHNGYVYFSYSNQGPGGANTAVSRAVLTENRLRDVELIFQARPFLQGGAHFGSRLLFDDEGYLYVSVGERGRPENAQDSGNHCGKLLRLHDDGSVPTDNPLKGVPDAAEEIFTMGNRNIQGMDIHPENRMIYTHEHGPRGGDELNVMIAGENYGWPEVTHGINYDGTPITPHTSLEGYKDPLYYWTPSVAPCGMTFVPENFRTPNGETILVGTLAGQHLKGVVFIDDEVHSTHRYFEGTARFRAVKCRGNRCFVLTEGPGKLYELVSKR